MTLAYPNAVCPPPSRGNPRRFTLVELLVVVAIIGILASLLMPALNKGLQTGRAAACMNNLKQISFCINAYTDDHNNWLPYVATHVWTVSDPNYPNWMQKYIPERSMTKAVVTCPSYKSMWYGSGNYGLSYHWFAYPTWTKPFRRIYEIKLPGKTLFCTDVAYEGTNVMASEQITTGNAIAQSNMHFRHLVQASVLWGDGHVAGYRQIPPSSAVETIWSGK